MNTAGLRLEQAPPIHVPFRFFLTAPFFLLAAAWVLGTHEAALASRWSPAALALTHLVAVGFLAQILCGALLQLLPVLAGAPVPGVTWVGTLVHLALTLGAGLLAWGFIDGRPWLLALGGGGATAGLLLFAGVVGLAARRGQGAAETLTALRLALVSLGLTLASGMTLVGVLNGWWVWPGFLTLVDWHLSWGLLGWTGLLIVGVAFQLVPLFHVTPPYPAGLRRWLVPGLFAALAVTGVLALAEHSPIVVLGRAVMVAGFGLFALTTGWLQYRRERRRIDATLLHWWSALACLLAAGLGWVLGMPPEPLGLLLLFGVGVGLPCGMLFKILPFLAWFHLQHRQLAAGRLDVRVPHMLKFLPDRGARGQFACHLVALGGLLGAWAMPRPATAWLAAMMLGLSALVCGGLLMVGSWRFWRLAVALGSPAPGSPPD